MSETVALYFTLICKMADKTQPKNGLFMFLNKDMLGYQQKFIMPKTVCIFCYRTWRMTKRPKYILEKPSDIAHTCIARGDDNKDLFKKTKVRSYVRTYSPPGTFAGWLNNEI